MDKNTLRVLGEVIREQLPITDIRQSKELRRLIVQLERRQRERDRQRNDPPDLQPH
jgi:hypothetical protein